MWIKPEDKKPNGKLTFIIRDSSPLEFMLEPVTHRTVTIELTEEQINKLSLRWIGNRDGDLYEEISTVFYEEGKK